EAQFTIPVDVWAHEPTTQGDVDEGLVLVPQMQFQDAGKANVSEGALDAPVAPDASGPAEAADSAVAVAPAYPGEGRESIICAVFGDQCAKALRVAHCESGSDLSSEWDGNYVGPFQIYPGHAAKFSAHGWD